MEATITAGKTKRKARSKPLSVLLSSDQLPSSESVSWESERIAANESPSLEIDIDSDSGSMLPGSIPGDDSPLKSRSRLVRGPVQNLADSSLSLPPRTKFTQRVENPIGQPARASSGSGIAKEVQEDNTDSSHEESGQELDLGLLLETAKSMPSSEGMPSNPDREEPFIPNIEERLVAPSTMGQREQKIKDCIRDSFSKDERDSMGRAYVFATHLGQCGYYKIGVSGTPEDRKSSYHKKCEFPEYWEVYPIPYESIFGFKRLEKLAHIELGNMNIMLPPCRCSVTHTEFFAGHKQTAIAVLKRWATWLRLQKPYDETGTLKPFWHYRLDNFDKLVNNITCKAAECRETKDLTEKLACQACLAARWEKWTKISELDEFDYHCWMIFGPGWVCKIMSWWWQASPGPENTPSSIINAIKYMMSLWELICHPESLLVLTFITLDVLICQSLGPWLGPGRWDIELCSNVICLALYCRISKRLASGDSQGKSTASRARKGSGHRTRSHRKSAPAPLAVELRAADQTDAADAEPKSSFVSCSRSKSEEPSSQKSSHKPSKSRRQQKSSEHTETTLPSSSLSPPDPVQKRHRSNPR
jgi:hypothetical protein